MTRFRINKLFDAAGGMLMGLAVLYFAPKTRHWGDAVFLGLAIFLGSLGVISAWCAVASLIAAWRGR